MGGFPDKPVLVFWETTRACLLSCVHCRASAIREPLPGELSTEEGRRLIDKVSEFGSPAPTMIFTGGDPLLRGDLFELLSYARSVGVRFAVSPAVTELLTYDTLRRIKEAGASAISVSLDGACASTHDYTRRKEGTYDRTLRAIRDAVDIGLNIQVNTAIMKRNYDELPLIFDQIKGLGIKVWELFFLVKVGRGSQIEDLTPEQCEDVCNFLYDVSFRGMTVRCVEAPFIRRVAHERSKPTFEEKDGYLKLKAGLLHPNGQPLATRSTLSPRGTLDGDGIIFVGYDGDISPGGLVPAILGNVKRDKLTSIYRENNLLREVRMRNLHGFCGVCGFKEMCGGSRARAFSRDGDPLGSDPSCVYGVVPGSTSRGP
jgi:AdoMet-dependent heme synthase